MCFNHIPPSPSLPASHSHQSFPYQQAPTTFTYPWCPRELIKVAYVSKGSGRNNRHVHRKAGVDGLGIQANTWNFGVFIRCSTGRRVS